jgi:colicin import membrane protein
MQGNPRAEFQVTVMPDCSITAVRLRRSSGLPAWDQAAERAIQRSSPLPRLPDGKCPSDLTIAHAPREER